MQGKNDFQSEQEGAIIVALDNQKGGLLFGAVELRGGEEFWLDYELELDQAGETTVLYRQAEDIPVLEYCSNGQRMSIVTVPDRLLLLWNHGHRTLDVDGMPLLPGEISVCVPEGITPWILRFATWLPR